MIEIYTINRNNVNNKSNSGNNECCFFGALPVSFRTCRVPMGTLPAVKPANGESDQPVQPGLQRLVIEVNTMVSQRYMFRVSS